jgi:type I restriction enzyme S subunit
MFITRASPQLLGTRRIDPDYYAPVHVADEKRLRQFGSFELGDCGRFFVGPFGSELPSSLYRPSGVPLLRVGNVGQLDMSEDNLVFLDEATHKHLEASETLPGDLLIVKASVGEKICRFPTRYDRGNITQHIIGIRPNGHADMDYVAVSLFMPIGRRQLERRSLGSIIQYLGVVDARTVLVPRIVPDAQRYIGDKVRQAERLRERARQLEAAVAATHSQYVVPPTGIDFTKRTRRLASPFLTERLDAHFYPSAVEQYFGQLAGSTSSLDRLCFLVVNGQSQPEAEEGVKQATVANLGRSFVEGPLRTVVRPADGSRALTCHDLLLCNAAHNKSYIGRDVTYSQVEGVYPSTEVMVVRVDRTQIPASFVRHYLKTEIGYLQVQSTIRGITAHSYPTDVKLLEIPIPAVSDVDRDAWFATDDQMLAAGRCFDAAKALTSVATTLVEQLIDGRLTEAELVAAHKALEGGDCSADREILKSVRESNAPDATPLIADVDALYALLDDSEGQGP